MNPAWWAGYRCERPPFRAPGGANLTAGNPATDPAGPGARPDGRKENENENSSLPGI